MTFLSRILGLVRDILIARFFGTSIGTDAFFIAFKIPNLFRRLFAEGAFSQAFVPILAKSANNDSEAQTQILINEIGAFLLKALVIITLIGVIFAPLVITIFAFGFKDNSTQFMLATDMLRITFPYLLFISLTAFAGAILNVYNRFSIPAFTPVLLNASIIVSAIFLANHLETPIMALSWGVLLGGVVQLLFQIPFLKKINRLPKLRLQFKKSSHPAIATLKARMLPAMFGVSVAQINLLIDTIIASFLITGSISWLYYSDRIFELPLALIGIALGTLALSKLSQNFAQKDMKAFTKTLDKGLEIAVILGVPAMVGLLLLSQPLIISLFGYGQFNDYDISQSSYSLLAYGSGLLFLIFIKVLAPAFYAMGDTKTPVRAGIIAMVSNVFLNLLFVYLLIDQGIAHAGLALATSVSGAINAGLLLYYLSKKSIYKLNKTFYQALIKAGVLSIIMALGIINFSPDTQAYQQADVLWRGIYLLSTTLSCAGFYFMALLIWHKVKPS